MYPSTSGDFGGLNSGGLTEACKSIGVGALIDAIDSSQDSDSARLVVLGVNSMLLSYESEAATLIVPGVWKVATLSTMILSTSSGPGSH